MSSPITSAYGSPSFTSGAIGEARAKEAIWATMEVGLEASKNVGSISLSMPAYRNVTPKKNRTGSSAPAGTLAVASRSRSDGVSSSGRGVGSPVRPAS